MKQLRSLGAACLLSLMLAVSASAGHIQTGIADPHTPPQSSATASEASDSATSEAASSPLVEAALNLISSVLTLF